jgi:beta-xylosidase
MKSLIILFLLLSVGAFAQQAVNQNGIISPDNGDGTYTNPVIRADFSDPDAIRAGDDFFLTSSSFVNTPGLPILHSKDLVNWHIINYAFINIPYGNFEKPLRGCGVWAPCIRFHNGEFYIYYGDPDYGIFMTKTKDPYKTWEPVKLIHEAKGWIDPAPFWDEDGSAYLVHAWARSRAGIKHRLTIHRMNPEGTRLLDEGTTVFDDSVKQPTLEGPKLYKRNGIYYILAPAGGVTYGWQAALRAKNIFGPYEDKIVMAQKESCVNGPHQGALVETQSGEWQFIHFQDKGAYGRIVHLQPVTWKDDWPVIGVDKKGAGCGEPARTYKKPIVSSDRMFNSLQTSDEFDSTALGLQWQWEANHANNWYSLFESKGNLRLYTQSTESGRLWDAPFITGQKFPAEEFSVYTKVDVKNLKEGEKAGVIVLGLDYFYITIMNDSGRYKAAVFSCIAAQKGNPEICEEISELNSGVIYLKTEIKTGARVTFNFSADGIIYANLGKVYAAQKGIWVGGRIGLFAMGRAENKEKGYADFDYFRFLKE